MKQTGAELADWAVRKVESEYKDDVCLLLEHRTLRLDIDQDQTSFSFYVPATSRANGLARTFIVEGVGYDLFPVSWERLEGLAEVKEYNTTLLADAEMLYVRNDRDRDRFASLQARLAANLQNPHLMYQRAMEWLNTVLEIYQDMLFEDAGAKVRENAGRICDLLATAVACANRTYFKHGQTNQILELSAMKEIPRGFTTQYERIIRAGTAEEQKRLCHELIATTKAFLWKQDVTATRRTSAPDFSELATWYQELSYTWRRVYHWCDRNDPVNAYQWGCFLQREVNAVGEEYGIADLDILGAFEAGNLSAFRARAEAVERKIVAALEANGVTINSYPSVESFLERNP
jgi:hypothetical protein